jgi:hypothetical protein
MRNLMLAAFVVVAATQAAPAANAACAESHGGTVHVHSDKCPRRECLDDCPVMDICAVLPDIQTTFGVGFECY